MNGLKSLGFLTIALVTPAWAAAQSATPSGCWLGSLGDGANERRAVLELVQLPAGWTGMFEVLNRTLDPDSITEVTMSGDSLGFSVPGMADGTTFTGAFRDNGSRIAGDLMLEGESRTLQLVRSDGRQSAGRSLVGAWSGSLEQNGAAIMPIIIKVAEAPCGDVLVTMDSPDQGATDLPITSLAVSKDSLRFTMRYVGGEYAGDISSDRQQITGQWVQNGATFALNLARGDSVTKPPRPQEPVRPYPYDEEDVTFINHVDSVEFGGTLTLPRTGAPFPAVVLLSGSGAQDRNETLLQHRPFLVIADYLTRRGIAVLRFDDRGVGSSSGSTMQATLEDNAGDALAAVQLLKSHPKIDASRIGLVGHSEGGWVAPIAASHSDDVAFVVLLAGPAVSGEALLYAQDAAMARAGGQDESYIAATRASSERIFALVKEGVPASELPERIAQAMDQLRTELSGDELAVFDSIRAQISPEQLDRMVALVSTPWFRFLLSYDPQPTLRALDIPVLALFAELDRQVPLQQNLPEMEAVLRSSGSPDYRVLQLDGLNHLFQTAETGHISEYATIEETFAPKALDAIGDWIVQQTRNTKGN